MPTAVNVAILVFFAKENNVPRLQRKVEGSKLGLCRRDLGFYLNCLLPGQIILKCKES